ncbi:MAG: helix-turn-helix transcriptional regulator [Verrucomicrobiota bacterium]|jgi:transcriptional regulator with XRE-family HTH domain
MQELFSEKMRERLRSARKEVGMTLEELSDGTGFAMTTFSSVENGHDMPSPRLLAAWTRRLRVNEEWLVAGTGRKFQRPRALFMIPPNELKASKARASSLRDQASWLIEQAEQLEFEIRESEDYHREKSRLAEERDREADRDQRKK